MKLIELIRYTLRHSLNDSGEYKDFRTAQELLEESKWGNYIYH